MYPNPHFPHERKSFAPIENRAPPPFLNVHCDSFDLPFIAHLINSFSKFTVSCIAGYRKPIFPNKPYPLGATDTPTLTFGPKSIGPSLSILLARNTKRAFPEALLGRVEDADRRLAPKTRAVGRNYHPRKYLNGYPETRLWIGVYFREAK